MDDLTVGYMLYLAIGCNKWFQLGFILMRARREGVNGEDDSVGALMSRAWPLVLVLAIFCSPSTNFSMDGVITYPYQAYWVDRSFYAAGTTLMIFVVDRVSRKAPCSPVPNV